MGIYTPNLNRKIIQEVYKSKDNSVLQYAQGMLSVFVTGMTPNKQDFVWSPCLAPCFQKGKSHDGLPFNRLTLITGILTI